MQNSVKILALTIAALLLCTLCVWWAVIREERQGILTVSFLDIGQGDAIFIDAPSGRQVLIDGGPNRHVLRELSRVLPWYDRSIDVVIATHPDADHINGLVDVLARYRVSLIVVSSVADEEGADAAALKDAAAKESEEGARLLTAERGKIIDLGGGAYIEILFPDRNVAEVETNLGSVVARLVYGETAFLFTGDSPQSVEKYLVKLDGDMLESSVLKVGHHGSRTSSNELFVGFVAPEYAVYNRGCGNRYGHPHDEVREVFSRFEIPTFDTCTEGTITFVSDGTSVRRD